MFTDCVKLLRPHQWIKNLLILLPAFFSRSLTDENCLIGCAIAIVCMSLMASSIYCFNDIIDVEKDRAHEKKRLRPIASGAVSLPMAYSLMGILAVVSLGIAYSSRWFPNEVVAGYNWNLFVGILMTYYLLNVSYSLWLKHLAIVDVFTVALGFVLRLVSGGPVLDIELSNWIVMMTFLLALFLVLAKRRDDVVIYERTGVAMRKNIVRYNAQFMNQAITVVASITLVCYIMYTVSPEVVSRIGSEYLYCTSFFVLAGVLRYLQLSIVDNKSGSPTKVVMHDKFTQLCILGWVVMFILLLYW